MMTYRTLTMMGTEINAMDMHGNPTEPFVPFSVRVPQFTELKDGTLLYCFQAKYNSQLDEEPCCQVMMRSCDGGNTWGEARLLTYKGAPLNMWGVPVYDEVNDALVYLGRTRHWKPGFEEDRLLTEEDQVKGRVDERFWVAKSADGGLSWSDYKEVVLDAPKDWRVQHCLTPGSGIQLKHQLDKSKNGRLVVPANHIGANEGGKNEFGAHVLISDDFGETWRTGAVQDYTGGNECLITELSDGTLILNCRGQGCIPANVRLQSISKDGGDTFAENGPVESLYDPCCHGGFTSGEAGGKEYVYCSLPTGELENPWSCLGVVGRWGKREKMMLYRSSDGGRTYNPVKQLSPQGEFAAYSALQVTRDGKLLCAWESGPENGLYRDIKYMMLDPCSL